MILPGEELGDGMGGEDRRAISAGNPLDFGLEILVGDDGEFSFEGVGVGGAGEGVTAEILGGGVSGQDFGEDGVLYGVGVASHLFDELKSFGVLFTGGRAERGRERRIDSHFRERERMKKMKKEKSGGDGG